ncbi:ergot alkaloid biosynthesis protein [Actinosynnema sp.]|uniref:ergot alkaloid biosynthesis protein n=1 Tax=Actinosynnema sp. TaxID=1872144 RepID=UPI003F86F442
MSVVVIGASGTTGRALTALLEAGGTPFRRASRTPAPGATRFDWHDPSTHRGLLDGATAVYAVPPPTTGDPLPAVRPLLDLARRTGLPRLVLLGSLAVLPDAPGAAELEAEVRGTPGWSVLRPAGFMQNLTGAHPLAARVRERGELLSASGDGRVGWIDARDVAAAAHAALLADRTEAEHRLTGPRALSYPEAARIITERTGRTVEVVEVSADELAGHFRAAGMPAPFADRLARYNAAIRDGGEGELTDGVTRLTGRAPRPFAGFVDDHRAEWATG